MRRLLAALALVGLLAGGCEVCGLDDDCCDCHDDCDRCCECDCDCCCD